MTRSYNFSAGPSALPFEVLQEAHDALFDYEGTGMSIMEMSHRSETFMSLAYQAEKDLRDILNVPDNYEVLFVQGGATQQFSQVPLNLIGAKRTADYIHTGLWSGKAINAAHRYCDVRVVASSEATSFDRLPSISHAPLNPDAAYLHYTENETVHGVQFDHAPNSTAPLVCDACSSLLSKPIDVAKHGLIYASAQKNMGASGITTVIVASELLGHALPVTPDIMNYQRIAKARSMINTPPTFAWYLTGLTLKWLRRQGGLEAIHRANRYKAKITYKTIDQSEGFYVNRVHASSRSMTNIPFSLADSKLEKLFLKEAQESGLAGLKGHASVGGMRASLYNAVTPQATESLCSFMDSFAKQYG